MPTYYSILNKHEIIFRLIPRKPNFVAKFFTYYVISAILKNDPKMHGYYSVMSIP